MATQSRVRTPRTHLWRRFRYSVMPYCVFFISVGLVGVLWQRHAGRTGAVGEVYAQRADVTSPLAGVLASLLPSDPEPNLYADVQLGDVIARLDEGPTRASIAALQAELVHLSQEIPAAAENERLAMLDRQLNVDRQTQENGFEILRLKRQLAQLELDDVQQQAQIVADNIALETNKNEIGEFKAVTLEGAGLTGRLRLAELRITQSEIEGRIKGAEQTRKELARQKVTLNAQMSDLTTTSRDLSVNEQAILAPLEAAVEAQAALVQELEEQRKLLTIRAPIAGMVTAIYTWPGEAVQPNMPILTIAAKDSQYVVSYIRQEQRFQPTVGMRVEVVARSIPVKRVPAQIERIGAQVELVPEHQRALRDQNMLEWGLPVWIRMLGDAQLRPGELVDLRFR